MKNKIAKRGCSNCKSEVNQHTFTFMERSVIAIWVYLFITFFTDAFGESPAVEEFRAPQKSFHFGSWQFLPNGLIYPAYLAGVQESRIGGVWNKDENLDWIWDATLGGHLPLLRKGSRHSVRPVGSQLDFEGSAHLRLDLANSFEMYSTDYRAGIPWSCGNQRWQFKTGFYHVSSHAADEFIIRQVQRETPFVNQGRAYRYNYSRDSWILALAYRPHPDWRLYGELDYDFVNNAKADAGNTKPLHIQFGAEYSAPFRSDRHFGSPFAAMNVILYEEKDYNGSICLQTGWQYRGVDNRLVRAGIQYFYGVSEQYQNLSSYWKPENKIGFGLWYDF